MADYYLDFENPLKEIDQKIIELEIDTSSKDHSSEIIALKSEKELTQKKYFFRLVTLAACSISSSSSKTIFIRLH